MENLEALRFGEPPQVNLPRESIDEIAELALRLSQEDAQRHGRVCPPQFLLPYQERTEQMRSGLRVGVIRVIQALLLLGWIDEPPGGAAP